MTARNYVVLGLIVLLAAGAAEAQLEKAGTLVSGLEMPKGVGFGEIALATVGSHQVVVALDSEAEDGLTDLMIAFEASEPVDDLGFFRGYGLVRLTSNSVSLTFPELDERLLFSTGAAGTVTGDREDIAVRRFLDGRSLMTWIPHEGGQLTLEQALEAEIRHRESGLRSLAAGVFEKEPEPGGGDGGPCATSCSVTCHDGTSCSATCPTNCAVCNCPQASCGCFGA